MLAPSDFHLLLGRTAAALLLCLPASLHANEDPPFIDPASVVVVANKAVPDSLQVAHRYLELRSIPERNLLLLDTLPGERISRKAFRQQIRNPLLRLLAENEFISGLERDPDDFGRSAMTLFKRPAFRYLVLCYGVPARITEEKSPDFDDAPLRTKAFKENNQILQAFAEGPLARNEASVDTELALLLKSDVPFTGFVPNPLFQEQDRSTGTDVLRVTRLDGPSAEAVILMIRNGLRAEQSGLRGRAYVDEDGRKGNYASGNDWLRKTTTVFSKLAFDLSHDTDRATFSNDARFDAPALYAGWYARSLNGPFTLPGFRFPPGAVAAHLHSFSASPIRSTDKGWVGPLVERGVSATFGNVAEPYLRYTHHFHLFFAALAEGWTFAEAAYFALPALSWQGVAIGDPLYRPFAKRLPEQLEAIEDPAAILENQYVALRRINQLLSADQPDQARKLATRAMRDTPGPALALRRAQLLLDHEEPAQARKALDFFTRLPPTDSSQWGLYAAMADFLLQLDDADSALQLYQLVLEKDLPDDLRLNFLRRAIPAANKAGRRELADDWQDIVNPPANSEEP